MKPSEFHEQFKFEVTIRPQSGERKRMAGGSLVVFPNVEEQINLTHFPCLGTLCFYKTLAAT